MFYRTFTAASYPAVWSVFRGTRCEARHWYEVIREGRPAHLYFDLEYPAQLNPQVPGAGRRGRACLLGWEASRHGARALCAAVLSQHLLARLCCRLTATRWWSACWATWRHSSGGSVHARAHAALL